MKRKIVVTVLLACLPALVPLYAGTGLHMKCGAKAEKGAGAEGCGYEALVTFGGGMFFDQLTGYCRKCKKFVYLRWTREGIPAEMKQSIEAKPRPEPLGEIWNAQPGKVHPVHACPTCKGPFLEIKTPKELTHCPACNEPGFAADPRMPVMAID